MAHYVKIAWEWARAFEGWQQLFAVVELAQQAAMCCLSVGKSPGPQERWGALGGWVQIRQRSVPLFLLLSYRMEAVNFLL